MTNALENTILDNFSSRTYKDLPSVGSWVVDPHSGRESPYRMPAGGRDYTRVRSLINLGSRFLRSEP